MSPSYINIRMTVEKSSFKNFFTTIFYNNQKLFLKKSSFSNAIGTILYSYPKMEFDNKFTIQNEEYPLPNGTANIVYGEEGLLVIHDCHFKSIIVNENKPLISIKNSTTFYMTNCVFSSCSSYNSILNLNTRATTISHVCCSDLDKTGDVNNKVLFMQTDAKKDSFFQFVYSTISGKNSDSNSDFIYQFKEASTRIQCINTSFFRTNKFIMHFTSPRCLNMLMNSFCNLYSGEYILHLNLQDGNQEERYNHYLAFSNFESNTFKENCFNLDLQKESKYTIENCYFLNTRRENYNDQDSYDFFKINNDQKVHVDNCYFDIKFNIGDKIDVSKTYIDNNLKLPTLAHFFTENVCRGDEDIDAHGCKNFTCPDLRGCKENAFDFNISDGDVAYTEIYHEGYDTPTPSPTVYFTSSFQFSMSNNFSKTLEFTLSKSFSKTSEFTKTTGFTKTDYFSKTGYFTKTGFFSKSTFFSKSAFFSESNDFTQSKDFNKTGSFSVSAAFTKTGSFSETSDFSKSKFFSKSLMFNNSKEFTESFYFSNSKYFTKTNAFSQTGNFSKSIVFSKSIAFTKSNAFEPTEDFDHTHFFTPSSFFTKSFMFSSSSHFSESIKFSESSDFSKTAIFKSTEYFTQSSNFSNSLKFDATFYFSSSKAFSKTAIFKSTEYFTQSSNFSNSLKFDATFYFTNSKAFSKTDFFSDSFGFTNSDYFSKTKKFTDSKDLNKTNTFSPSKYFSCSDVFTLSNDFSSSKNFTYSETFEPEINIYIKSDETNKISTGIKIGIGLAAGAVGVSLISVGIIFLLRKRSTPVEDFNEETFEINNSASTALFSKNPLMDIMNNDDPFEDEFDY